MPCPEGKIAYPSPQAAWRALRHLLRRRQTRQQRHRGTHGVYVCPYRRDQYHTGHQQEKGAAA